VAELLQWLNQHSPAVVALLVLGAALLFVLKLVTERSIASGFQAQTKALELALGRRSAFEEKVLTERYALVSSFVSRLERLATQLNRVRHGQDIPEDFRRGTELVPLTEVFEDLTIHRFVLGEDFFSALQHEAEILLEIAQTSDPKGRAKTDDAWLSARARVRAVAEEQFRISEIRFR
jgi:hypothetical protein